MNINNQEPCVAWKSEGGGQGRTLVFTNGRPFAWPWGQLPDGCIDHGWTTHDEAKRLAITLGFELEAS